MNEARRHAWLLVFLPAVAIVGVALSQGTWPAAEAQPRSGAAAGSTLQAPAVTSVDQAKAGASQAVAAAAGPTGVAATTGTSCVAAVSGSGEAKFQSTAETHAKGDWQNVAAGTYGGSWDWTQAANPSLNCHHNGLGPIQRRWTCTATAEPCQTVLTCKPFVEVEGGSAKLQSGAETNAENQWQHDAGDLYGTAFKYWGQAQNKTMSCHHNGLGPLQRRWRCTARARPCG
ncbi:MAG: hypothetical protein JOZ90_09760 [Alphaproteobacteria bacterium]|nr:hypothetical protein [Alphaproteobacteria bacterium]MBV9373002.1 hypothetical protein [Alphaproteobacteria bacterium]MBV9901369.1 hypothetical protein [Alphaproteobacteria bacterium]